MDTVWDQAFRGERAEAKGEAAAAILVDMRCSYDYEKFDHDLLADRARASQFPSKILALALAGYKAPRLIVSRGKAMAPLYARRGVIAGCGLATTWVKVYCLSPLEAFAKRHPKVKLEAYIDDLTLSTTGPSDKNVEVRLVAAAKDLLEIITKELRCDLAYEKTAVIASNDELAATLAKRLACTGAVPAASTASLGVDLTCGRKRAAHKASGVRKLRFAKGLKRMRRIRNIRQVIGGAKGGRVAAAGCMAATEYGSAVNGVSDSELAKLQKIAASGMTPSASGRSRTALFATKGDPTWRAAVAPVLQWIQVAWRTNRMEGETTKADLKAAWTETATRRTKLVSDDDTQRLRVILGADRVVFGRRDHAR